MIMYPLHELNNYATPLKYTCLLRVAYLVWCPLSLKLDFSICFYVSPVGDMKKVLECFI